MRSQVRTGNDIVLDDCLRVGVNQMLEIIVCSAVKPTLEIFRSICLVGLLSHQQRSAGIWHSSVVLEVVSERVAASCRVQCLKGGTVCAEIRCS